VEHMSDFKVGDYIFKEYNTGEIIVGKIDSILNRKGDYNIDIKYWKSSEGGRRDTSTKIVGLISRTYDVKEFKKINKKDIWVYEI